MEAFFCQDCFHPKVRLIREKDNGTTTEQVYALPEGLTNLDEIDEAIE